MTNMKQLVTAISRKGKTREAVADAAGMNRATFYRKIKNDGGTFTIDQVRKMAEFIPLSSDEIQDIFLEKKSQ